MMYKQSKSAPQPKKAARPTPYGGERMAFNDRNLMGVSPLKEQFEPTDAQPVRQHYKMAGGC